jgi:signal transduction histidine kinase
VADDGPGGPVTEEGNGIRGMRERARAVGGTVTLAPRPSGGLLLHAELPLDPAPSRGWGG